MQSKKAEIKQYIASQINVFVQPMVYNIVKNRPTDPATFAINWLKEWVQNNTKKVQNSDSQPEEDEQQTVCELQAKIQRKKLQGKSRSRIAISQEVFGNFNKRASVELREIPKSSEDEALIQSLIKNSILFQNVDPRDQETLIKAMEEVEYETGDVVIKEGEDGDHLFVVESGQYDCSKLIGGEDKYLKTYKQGELFGQLALMYNAPRAASITCKEGGKLYKLDRTTFSQVVKGAAARKRELFRRVLDQIQIFSSISSIQKQQFLDILKQERHEANEYVIKQGEHGNKFYIVLEGELAAEKHDIIKDTTKIVYNYREGDYFGELALLHDISRQASVKTLTPARLVYLDRESFKRIFGSMQEILKRNEQRYESSRKNLVCA